VFSLCIFYAIFLVLKADFTLLSVTLKGTNNVSYVDNGFLAATIFNTGDAGIQDNNQHYLGGPYRAGREGINAGFIFDKSFASDPSCSIRIH
jgi:hypothetical protein